MDIVKTFYDIDNSDNIISFIKSKNINRDITQLKTYFSGFHGNYYKRKYKLVNDLEKVVCKVYIDEVLKIIIKPVKR